MREYIIEIDEEVSDESETFIGFIRRHSDELIRCKECEHRDTDEACFIWNFVRVNDDGYCNYAKRKKNEP